MNTLGINKHTKKYEMIRKDMESEIRRNRSLSQK